VKKKGGPKKRKGKTGQAIGQRLQEEKAQVNHLAEFTGLTCGDKSWETNRHSTPYCATLYLQKNPGGR